MGLRMMPFFKGKKGFQFAGGGNVDKFDDLPVATTTSIGCVKADGTTINVNSSGTISTTALLKKSTMPEASASELDNIYMYTGADTESFTSGHVYKCVSDEDPDTPTYSWDPVELEDPYTLPTATTSTLGGVKVGGGIDVSNDGTISQHFKMKYCRYDFNAGEGNTITAGNIYTVANALVDVFGLSSGNTVRGLAYLISGYNVNDPKCNLAYGDDGTFYIVPGLSQSGPILIIKFIVIYE